MDGPARHGGQGDTVAWVEQNVERRGEWFLGLWRCDGRFVAVSGAHGHGWACAYATTGLGGYGVYCC